MISACETVSLLAHLVDPAEGVGDVAVLDAEKLLAQAPGDRARLAVRDGPLRGGALDPADRGDHGRGPAGEHLGQLARGAPGLPLLDGDLVLDGLDAQFGG